MSIFLVGWVPVGIWARSGRRLAAVRDPALLCRSRPHRGGDAIADRRGSSLTPTRHRTIATSFYVVFASAGGFLPLAISAAVNMGPYGGPRVPTPGFRD